MLQRGGKGKPPLQVRVRLPRRLVGVAGLVEALMSSSPHQVLCEPRTEPSHGPWGPHQMWWELPPSPTVHHTSIGYLWGWLSALG